MSVSEDPETTELQRQLLLIGIGAGDPDYVTTQAVRAIQTFDVLFVVTKADETEELVKFRTGIVDRYRDDDNYRTVELPDPARPWSTSPNYGAAVALWREQRADLWEQALTERLDAGEIGAFLVWGDPSLYESTLAVVQDVLSRGKVNFDYEVIPGVSSVHALTARHRIPLNRVGGAVQITPARLLTGGLPLGIDDVVVMLDANNAFTNLDPHNLHIYWGAYLGTEDEILIEGPLADVADEIVATRAAAKERKDWMFDTYLLRRTARDESKAEVERRQGVERRRGADRRAV
jgi:precorrin-6A synthase